jgi:hypothetical protein
MTVLEKTRIELQEVKGLLLNLRSGANSQAVPDFTIIPKLPLDNADNWRSSKIGSLPTQT